MRNSHVAKRWRRIPADDPVTPATQWAMREKAIPKVDGKRSLPEHQYTKRLRPAGMFYGKVLARRRLVRRSLPAMTVLRKARPASSWCVMETLVGVAAPSAHEAQRALRRDSCPMEEVPQISSKEIFSYLKQNAPANRRNRFRKQKGSVRRGAGKRGATG